MSTEATEDPETLQYLEVHTKGYSSTHDAVILAAPRRQLGEMQQLAERLCSVNGRYGPATPQRVYGLAVNAPDVLYGYELSRETEGAPVAALLRQCAQRTVQDLAGRG